MGEETKNSLSLLGGAKITPSSLTGEGTKKLPLHFREGAKITPSPF